MAPQLYSKIKSADLDALLQLRSLPAGGTKLEKISRLVMQDHEEEKARKQNEASIRAASNATAPAGDASVRESGDAMGNGSDSVPNRARRRDGMRGRSGPASRVRRRWIDEREVKTKQEKMVADHEREEEEQLEMIKDLIAGDAITTGRPIPPELMRRGPASPGIVVNMTPKDARGAVTSTASRRSSQLVGKKGGVETEKEKETGRWRQWRLTLGAVLVFAVILGMVLGLEIAVKWYWGVVRA